MKLITKTLPAIAALGVLTAGAAAAAEIDFSLVAPYSFSGTDTNLLDRTRPVENFNRSSIVKSAEDPGKLSQKYSYIKKYSLQDLEIVNNFLLPQARGY